MSATPNVPKLTVLKSAHTSIRKASDDAKAAIASEKAKELSKAKQVVTDVIALRREQFSLTEISRRYGQAEFSLWEMTDVEDGLITDPERLLQYAKIVQLFAEWKGMKDVGGGLPIPPWVDRNPDGTPILPQLPPDTKPPVKPGDVIAPPPVVVAPPVTAPPVINVPPVVLPPVELPPDTRPKPGGIFG